MPRERMVGGWDADARARRPTAGVPDLDRQDLGPPDRADGADGQAGCGVRAGGADTRPPAPGSADHDGEGSHREAGRGSGARSLAGRGVGIVHS
jgi:hypothetical protein